MIHNPSKKQNRMTRSTYGAELRGFVNTTELARTIACAYTELYRGTKQFEHIVKIDDHGNYLYFIGTIIVAADCKKPAEASLITMYLVH